MSDSEHSASDVERKPSTPPPRRAPINFDSADESADDDDARSPRRDRDRDSDRKSRVKEERDATVRSRSRDDDDEDDEDDDRDDRRDDRRDRDRDRDRDRARSRRDDDDEEEEDEIQPRRDEKKSRRRDDDSDDDDDGGPRRSSRDDDDDDDDRKRRIKREEDDRYSDEEEDDDGYASRDEGRKRKRVKKEGESRKKRRSSYDDAADGYGDEEEEEEAGGGEGSTRKRKRDPTAMERAIEQTKALRRPRKKEVDMTAVENECIVFLERMMKARDDDLRAYRAGRPPLEKIKMLREVETMMTKVSHREYLLDNMMLPVFKAWLDRLPDGALPNIDVRTTLLRILADCRVDEDWLGRLEESQGLGKVIHFLSRSDDHEPNRRIAQKLMEKWARLVYRSNSNFHDLQDEFDKPEDGHKAGKDSVAAERKAALHTVRNFKTTQERMRAFKHREKTNKTELDMMASIPRATPFLFTTMAESSQDVDQRAAREMRAPKARTRRVTSTLANLRKMNKSNSARAARPSLNGR